MCLGPFRRFCHWGPLFALGIIKLVTLCTIHCSYLLWPQHSVWGSANFYIFLALSASTLYCFLCAMYIGPGLLQLKWRPEDVNDEQYLQFCERCRGFKAPRAHHCSKCNRCVMKMDHHCPWINNCVGHRNHAFFVCFLASAVAGCSHGAVICSLAVIRLITHSREVPFVLMSVWELLWCLLAIGLCLGVVCGVSVLLFYQLKAIWRNQTALEDWILQKARHRRLIRLKIRQQHLMERQSQGEDVCELLEKFQSGESGQTVFANPYDLGWRLNCSSVLTAECRPVGDGIWWSVARGCDQFTLTREQLQQKREKRERMRRCVVVEKYSAHWLPITKGWSVIYHIPCTVERRIHLHIGDVVLVSRWRKHWLYGEVESHVSGDRRRGWFPRRCVQEEHGDCAHSTSEPPCGRDKTE